MLQLGPVNADVPTYIYMSYIKDKYLSILWKGDVYLFRRSFINDFSLSFMHNNLLVK